MLSKLIVAIISQYYIREIKLSLDTMILHNVCYMSVVSIKLGEKNFFKNSMCSLAYLSKQVGMTTVLADNETFSLPSVCNIHYTDTPRRTRSCSLPTIHQQQPRLLHRVEAYSSHYFLRKEVIFNLIGTYNNRMI